jgi:putative ABC transport system ATP-binding protein
MTETQQGGIPMLYVKNLHKSYQSGNKSYPVLKGIDLSVADQEFTAVMGPSGSGKSTLLNCISCYIPFDEGTITLGSQQLKGLSEDALAKVRNEKLGFVFQDFMLLDGLTIRENILVPRIIRGKTGRDAEKLTDQLLALFGIEHISDKYPADVSGGERQRTAVARSLINQPLLLLADEPTGNLDSKSSRTVIESFENARDQLGASIFMVTHDSFAASFCDRVILLKDGRVYDNLKKEESQSAFQDRLLAAIKQMSSETV